MFPGETVFSGAPHPGTDLAVLRSAAGFYVGFLDEEGLPYSRETDYFPDEESAQQAIAAIEDAVAKSANVRGLAFVR